MRVEVWADVVCPWCYIGQSRFRAALDEFPGRGQVEVVHRSFELDPHAPTTSELRTVELLSRKYGVSLDQARAMEQRVAQAAAAEGLTFTPDRPVANTRDAHRLLHLAGTLGRRGELLTALYEENFVRARSMGDPGVLREAAVGVGLPPDRVAQVLSSREFDADVLADQDAARALGSRGVPFYVFNRRVSVSGAQPPDLFLEALRQADAHLETSSP